MSKKRFSFLLCFIFSLCQLFAFRFKKEIDGVEQTFEVETDPVLKQVFEFYNLLYFDNKIDIAEVGWTDCDKFIAATYFYPSSKKVMFAVSKPRTDKLKLFKDITQQKKYDWLVCHELIHGYLVQYEEPDLTHTSPGWKKWANWFRKEKGVKIVDKQSENLKIGRIFVENKHNKTLKSTYYKNITEQFK